MVDKEVSEEAERKNHGVCMRETNIQTFYRRREYGGFYQVTKVVGPITRTKIGGEEGRVKEITVYNIKKLIWSSSLALCRKVESLIHT